MIDTTGMICVVGLAAVWIGGMITVLFVSAKQDHEKRKFNDEVNKLQSEMRND